MDNGFHEFSSTNIYKAHFRPENTSTISFCRHLDSDRPGAVRIPVNTNCLFTSHTALNNAQTTEKSEARGICAGVEWVVVRDPRLLASIGGAHGLRRPPLDAFATVPVACWRCSAQGLLQHRRRRSPSHLYERVQSLVWESTNERRNSFQKLPVASLGRPSDQPITRHRTHVQYSYSYEYRLSYCTQVALRVQL